MAGGKHRRSRGVGDLVLYGALIALVCAVLAAVFGVLEGVL